MSGRRPNWLALSSSFLFVLPLTLVFRLPANAPEVLIRKILDDDKSTTVIQATNHTDAGRESNGKGLSVLPPLPSLLSEETNVLPTLNPRIHKHFKIIGNVDFLLDLAVVGFAKCGTSTLKKWLNLHPQIRMLPSEQQHMKDEPALLVKKLYETRQEFQNSSNATLANKVYFGYKNPTEVRKLNESMANIRHYFPSAKLIITVRHPITWFKSLWDFSHIQQHKKETLLRRQQLIGGPHENTCCVRTGKAEWHALLAQLGKTNWTTHEGEQALLRDFLRAHELPPPGKTLPRQPNPIFLLEMTQLADDNATRAQQLRQDLQDYLGLESELPPIIHKNKMEDKQDDTSKLLDICTNEWDAARKDMIRIGQAASRWISEYFIQSPDVHVSSPEYLKECLMSWTIDPCDIETG